MRLKNPSAVAAFQSQLSAILDKLMVLVAEEIKELVFDYCEELSREKTQNSALCERTREDQDEGIIYDSSNSFIIEPLGGHNETEEHMTQTDRREEAGNKLSVLKSFSLSAQDPLSVNCKFGQVSTVSENAPTNSQQEDCSQDGSEQSSLEPQFCSDPPEDDKDHLIDYNSPVDTECTPYQDISTNPDRSPDVEFHIKQEEESPGFETGNNETGLQMQTGQLDNSAAQVQPIAQRTRLIDNTACTIFVDSAGPAPLDPTGSMHTNTYMYKKGVGLKANSRGLPGTNKVMYKCEYCNKTYPFPSLLKAHSLRHTQEKLLVCRYCGKLFKWKYSLRRHEILHLQHPYY